MLVGEFSTSTQQLRLKTPLLRFAGETLTFTTPRSGLTVAHVVRLVLQVQGQPGTGL